MLNNFKKVNTSKLTAKVFATLLVITLTFTNFILLGSYIGEGMFSYASDINLTEQNDGTNTEHVKFNVYLDKENRSVNQINKDINADDLVLYTSISVKNGGYLSNSKIEFISTNFDLKNNANAEDLKLEGIPSGKSVELCFPIVAKKENAFNLGFLDMISQIKLTGTYVDNNGKNINIDTTKGVKISWTSEKISEENNPIRLAQEVVTNRICEIDGANKRVLQLKVTSGLNNNIYPIKTTNITVKVPTLAGVYPEEVVIASYGTIATNNKTAIDFTKNDGTFKPEDKLGSWLYDEANKTINITINNNADANNKVSWTKAGEDTFIITYIYPENTITEEVYSNVESKVKLYPSDTELTANAEFTKNIEDINGNILQLNTTITDTIYKGNMNIGKNTEFTTEWNLEVSYANLTNAILIGNDMQKDFFNEKTDDIANIEYKSTYINKANMLDILGEAAEIYVFDNKDIENGENLASKTIATLNKDSETDENGNIVIEYKSGIERMCMLTSQPVKEGILNIVNKKELNTQGFLSEELKEIENINTYTIVSTIDYKHRSYQLSKSLIKEPVSIVSLETDKNILSTTQENEINFTVTLKEDNIQYDLYKNPIIEIELPQYITSAVIEDGSVKLINENGLEISSKDVITNNNKKIIVVTLKGEQIEYKGNTQILIKAKLLTNKMIPTLEEEVLLRCANGKETVYSNEQTVATDKVTLKAVAEQGILPAITVSNYNLNIQEHPEITLMRTEKQEESGLLDANTEAITTTVKGTIINNTGDKVNNITVLGKIDKEKINTKLGSIISTTGTVYYTEDKEITLESSWKKEYTENATGYKIEFNELGKDSVEVFLYNVTFPEKVGTNKETEINYEIYSENTKSISSPSVLLQTEQEAKLELKVTPTVKDNEKIYEGQKLSYNIEVKNIGETTAKDIVISNKVPDGTTIFGNNESEWKVDSLEVGKTITKTFEITVNNLDFGEKEKTIENKTTVTAKYLETPLTNIVTNKLEKAILLVSFKLDQNYDNLKLNNQIRYIVSITNNTKNKIENLSIENTMPKELKYTDIEFIGDINSFEKLENDIYKSKVISLEPGQTKNIQIDAEVVNYNKEGLTNNIKVNWGDSETATYVDNREMKIPQPLTITLTSDKSEKEVKPGDTITYIATIKNESEEYISTSIVGAMSEGLEIIKLEKIKEIEDSLKITSQIQTGARQTIETRIELDGGETEKVRITALVSAVADKLENDLILEAQVQSIRGKFIEASNIITNTLKKIEIKEPEKPIDSKKPEETSTKPENQNSESTEQKNSNEVKTYSISGIAWLDENKDGKIDSAEKLLKDITVKIKNFKTGKTLTDENNKEITVKTNDKGEYNFTNLKIGSYVLVFDCDVKTYGVTTNGESKVAIVTEEGKTNIKSDVIEIADKNVSDLNVGLILNPKFDLQLDKYITKVTVKNSSETNVYNYDKSQLAKVEIPAKKIKGSIVIIEYTIDVTNKGEVSGYAKSIVDYISPELKFSSESNTSWYQGTDNNLYCIDISNDEIKPNETKSVKLILTKSMTEDNMGLVNNLAEICEDYNEYALEDTNSKPFNQEQKENDLSSADIIISVKTGSAIMYIGIIIACTLILGTGIYFINKKIIRN